MTDNKGEKKYKYDVSIYANFRNEAEHLYEWIVYHLLIGVEHFYLYNHLSKDDYLSVLQPFIDKGIVTLNNLHGATGCKRFGYKHCVKNYQNESKWITFIDLDEFIVLCDKKQDISAALIPFEKYNGVGLCWIFYGPNNHRKKTSGLVLEKFTKREKLPPPGAREYKTIANPRKIDLTRGFIAAHKFHYKSGFAVNESFKILGNSGSEIERQFDPVPSFEKFYIAHYRTKSLEDFVIRKAHIPMDLDGKYKFGQEPLENRIERARQVWEGWANTDDVVEDKTLFRYAEAIENYKNNED